jgi:hypothetical protein
MSMGFSDKRPSAGPRVYFEVYRKQLASENMPKETPTTFVPLTPEKIQFEEDSVDVLFGLFHVKWSDMPRPATYSVKIAERLTSEGVYLGTRLECKYPKNFSVQLYD